MKFVSAHIEDAHYEVIRSKYESITHFLRTAITDKLKQDEPPPRISRLIEEVEIVCSCPPGWLTDTSRRRKFVVPRQVMMYAMQRWLKMSVVMSGAYFNKDHATAIHARKLCESSYLAKVNENGDIVGILRKFDCILSDYVYQIDLKCQKDGLNKS